MGTKEVINEVSPQSPVVQTKVFLIGAACICAVVAGLTALRHFLPLISTWPQGWLNPFDAGITSYVNQFADRWSRFDVMVRDFEHYKLFKSAPVVTFLWFAFFLKGGTPEEILERRRKIVATVPLAIGGVLLARTLAVVLPFRERPMGTVALHFRLIHDLYATSLYSWSSFPSDHLVLFTTLAVGLLMASRPVGVIALFYTFFFIAFPRLYLGFHWPTDLLAGAMMGVALASVVSIAAYRNFIWRWATKFWQISPGLTAAFAFLVSYEIVDLFESPIEIAKTIAHHLL